MLENCLKKGMARSKGSDDGCFGNWAKMSGWSLAQSKTEKCCSQTEMTFGKLNI